MATAAADLPVAAASLPAAATARLPIQLPATAVPVSLRRSPMATAPSEPAATVAATTAAMVQRCQLGSCEAATATAAAARLKLGIFLPADSRVRPTVPILERTAATAAAAPTGTVEDTNIETKAFRTLKTTCLTHHHSKMPSL